MNNTLHIHVGSNGPNELPTNVACFTDLDAAIAHLRHALRDQCGEYEDQCAALEPHSDEDCEWHDVATDVEAALSSIADGDTRYHLTRHTWYGVQFNPPEGSDTLHFVTRLSQDRELCDVAQEQGDV